MVNYWRISSCKHILVYSIIGGICFCGEPLKFPLRDHTSKQKNKFRFEDRLFRSRCAKSFIQAGPTSPSEGAGENDAWAAAANEWVLSKDKAIGAVSDDVGALWQGTMAHMKNLDNVNRRRTNYRTSVSNSPVVFPRSIF